MLKSIILTITLFLTGCSNKTELSKIQYSEQTENKTVIYYIHRDGCPACNYMDEVFKNRDIKNIINKKFKLVKIDFKDQTSLPDSSMITNKTPTLYFVKNNKQIHKPIHALSVDKFKNILESLR